MVRRSKITGSFEKAAGDKAGPTSKSLKAPAILRSKGWIGQKNPELVLAQNSDYWHHTNIESAKSESHSFQVPAFIFLRNNIIC
jgi:hypothetical protein